MPSCPLCESVPHEPILHEEGGFLVVRTKGSKGHSFRVMVVYRSHIPPERFPPDLERKGMEVGRRFAERTWGLERGFAIYRDTYSSIPDHWHVVVADLERGEDFEQVLETPRIVFTKENPGGIEVAPLSRGRPDLSTAKEVRRPQDLRGGGEPPKEGGAPTEGDGKRR